MKDLVFLELITDNYYYKEKAFKGLTREIKNKYYYDYDVNNNNEVVFEYVED